MKALPGYEHIVRNQSSGFPTRSHTNRAVKPQKVAKRLEISDSESRGIVLSM